MTTEIASKYSGLGMRRNKRNKMGHEVILIKTGWWGYEIAYIILPTFLCLKLTIRSLSKPAHALTTVILKNKVFGEILAPDCLSSTSSSCSYQLCALRQVTEPLCASITSFPNGDGDNHGIVNLMLLWRWNGSTNVSTQNNSWCMVSALYVLPRINPFHI